MGRKKGAGGEAKKAAPRKRNPCPGIPHVGGRICHDPENGKTSCRQEQKEGSRKRALGTDDAADGFLVQGDENTGTDLAAFPPVPPNKKLDKGTDDEIKGEPHIRDDNTHVLKTKTELPRGTPVTNVAGAELEADDAGSAIQFYEFCRTFAEVFQIRKGQPEKVLKLITGGGRIGREVPKAVADLHISLLSVIQEDRGENPLDYSRDGDAWIIDTGKYISESTVIWKEIPLDCLNQGVSGYKKLSPSLKLHVLNFLCDETLSTSALRGWIVKQDENATEKKIAAKEKIHAAKEKEKELKERLKDEMAKSMFMRKGAEIKSLISQIKELSEDKEAAVNEEKLGAFLRTKPVRIDRGVAYWKFDGYCNKTAIMRQEFDTIGNNDKWFMFTEEEEKVVGNHVAPRSQFQCTNHTRAW